MSRVIFDYGAFKSKVHRSSQKAENALADQIIADCQQYVPKQEGILRHARVEHEGDGTQVVYETPYAAYQYYGCWPDGSHVIRNHTTAGTTTKWIEHAKASNNDKWLRVAQNAVRNL